MEFGEYLREVCKQMGKFLIDVAKKKIKLLILLN